MTTTPTPRTTSGRTLILARHAKAEHVHGKPDHDRELAPRGRRDARAIGQWLSDPSRAVVLDLALCSTSERTRQTLDAVRAGGASVKDVRFDARIYDASAAHLLDVLREIPESVNAVLMIGHAPGIPILATALVQDSAGSTEAVDHISQEFPTSALAVLGFEGRWTELAPETAYLRNFVVPRG
jgi:phosphohistidine phosphatase